MVERVDDEADEAEHIPNLGYVVAVEEIDGAEDKNFVQKEAVGIRSYHAYYSLNIISILLNGP